MITANFAQMNKAKHLRWNAEQKMKSWAGNINSINEDYWIEDVMNNFYLPDISNIEYDGNLEKNRFFVLFGNGKDAERFSDYKLANPTKDVTITGFVFVPNVNFDAGTGVGSYVVSIVNQKNESVTLSEIALCISTETEGGWNDDKVYMLSRDVFPDVVVQPNEYYTFTIAIA